MKHLTAIFTFTFLLHLSASAAVPLRWTVETSRAQPATFDEFAGATYDLEATLQTYGRPLEVVGEPRLYWQTNGMASAWWSAPATVSGNVLRATWTPACDVGARAYNCFIGITGTVYNAAFQLRLRPSPGAVPNVIDQPPRVLDLAHTVVVNPPWPTDATISSRIREVIHQDGITAEVNPAEIKGMVSNTVDKTYVESLGISSGLDTNAVRDIALYPATNYTDLATGEVVRLVGALESSVSSLESSKRDKTDLMTDWWIYPDGSKIRLYHVHHIEGNWYWQDTLAWVSDSPWSLFAESSELGDEETIDLYDGMTFELVARMTRDTLATTSDLTNSVQSVERQLADKADASDLAPVAADAASAFTYSKFVYDFCLGSASCHLITTNYVFGSDALSRTRFAWQSDMDAGTVPASMRLVDIVGGETNVVWDSRDWTVWYWNYRLAKYRAERAAEDDALRALIANRAPVNWASYTACGLTNPAATTTWLDTPSVVLSAGYAWQHQLDVGGVGYWCIQGNGFEVGGSGTNATLRISDFEGNDVFKIRKGNAMLAPVSSNMTEAVGFDGEWFWCQMKCDAQPEGEFAVDLAEGFYPEGDSCPAVVREYEDRGGGCWRCYWKVRPGIQSAACFGRFKVQVGSETTVEYSNAPTVPAIRFGNYKLEPVIPSGARVGDTVTFKITEITQ